jgi:hypothetical protein
MGRECVYDQIKTHFKTYLHYIEIDRLKSDNLNFNLYIKQIIKKICLKILTSLNLDRSYSFEALKYL